MIRSLAAGLQTKCTHTIVPISLLQHGYKVLTVVELTDILILNGCRFSRKPYDPTTFVTIMAIKLPRIVLTLFQSVDIASLAVFRLLFGLLMCLSMVRFLAKGWVDSLYLQPTFFFPYAGFSWVHPWPAWGMYLHVVLLAVLALLLACGCWYRLSMTLFFVLFTYLELLDQTNYLNHYYLISLLSLLMIFCPLHGALSIDAWRQSALRSATVPACVLYILRLQIALVYTFAGIAKINTDWLLHAQPLNIWLSARTDLPLLGFFFAQVWVHYAMSWASILFELTVGFLLLWRRTRVWTYVLVVGFHFLTSVLFPIGMFPWIMMVVTTLFFAPDWPRRWMQKGWPRGPMTSAASLGPLTRQRKLGLVIGTAYFVVQAVVPLRHHLYPGNVLWTEEGMRFSWKVMLVEKTGHVDFHVHDPVTGRTWIVLPATYLTLRQEQMMATRADMVLTLAHKIADDFRKKGFTHVEVRAEAYMSLNGRPSQLFIDPSVDLAKEAPGLASKPWIFPLQEGPPAQLSSSPS